MAWAKRAVSISLLIFAAIYLVASLSLPLGRAAKPGPGLIPVCIGIAITFFSLLHVIEVIYSEKGHSAEKREGALQRRDVLRLAGLIFSFVIYIFLFQILGYILSTIILVGATLHLLAMHGWARITLISIVTSAGSYYIFSKILGIPLPQGILTLPF